MIQYLTLTPDNQITEVATVEQATWLHVENPTSDDITKLSQRYEFPQDYLTAVLDNQEISRYETPKQSELVTPLLLLLQYPHQTLSPSGFRQIQALPFSMIITPEILITSCKEDLDFLPHIEHGQRLNTKLVSETEKITTQLAWLFSDLFNYHLKSIRIETDRLESELQLSTENKQLFELMDMQKSLIYFNSALDQNLNVLQKVYDSNLIMTSKESLTVIFDIIIETKQALASVKIQTELLAQLGNIFSAIVSNNMNIVMKVLTVITIILTIPTIIGGIYGMNVALPFSNEPNAFWWLLLAIGLLSLFTVWVLKKKKFF